MPPLNSRSTRSPTFCLSTGCLLLLLGLYSVWNKRFYSEIFLSSLLLVSLYCSWSWVWLKGWCFREQQLFLLCSLRDMGSVTLPSPALLVRWALPLLFHYSPSPLFFLIPTSFSFLNTFSSLEGLVVIFIFRVGIYLIGLFTFSLVVLALI